MQLVGGEFKSLEVLLLCFAFFLIKVTGGRAQHLYGYISIIGTVFCRTANKSIAGQIRNLCCSARNRLFFIRVPTVQTASSHQYKHLKLNKFKFVHYRFITTTLDKFKEDSTDSIYKHARGTVARSGKSPGLAFRCPQVQVLPWPLVEFSRLPELKSSPTLINFFQSFARPH